MALWDIHTAVKNGPYITVLNTMCVALKYCNTFRIQASVVCF